MLMQPPVINTIFSGVSGATEGSGDWCEQLFAASPDPTWIIDDGHFVLCNDAAVRFLGYPNREALQSTHPSKLSPPRQPDGEDSFSKAERMMQMARKNGLHRFEWVHTKRNGSEFTAEVTLSAITLNHHPALYCVWRDISERKQNETLLRQSQNRLHDILESAADAIFITDAQGRYFYANRQASELVGYTNDELLQMQITDLVPEEDIPQTLNDFQCLLKQGHLRIELNLRHRNGQRIPIEINATRLADGNTYASCRDISDRIQLEKTREDALHRLELIASQVPGIVFQFRMDERGHITIPYVSDGLRRIYRIDPIEAMKDPRPALGLVHPDDAPAMVQSLKDSAARQQIWDMEYRILFPGEPAVWLHANAVPRLEESGCTLWHGYITDITEQKAINDRIRHLAQHDSLTGLLNRSSLKNRLEQHLALARPESRTMAIMFLDLDRFKQINDTLGHAVGDGLLVEVARRLSDCVRNSDILARLGGDEFIVVLTDVENAEAARRIAEKILAVIGQDYTIETHQVRTTPSIGLALFPENGEDYDTLLRHADAAMYQAKTNGRNNVQRYSGGTPDTSPNLGAA